MKLVSRRDWLLSSAAAAGVVMLPGRLLAQPAPAAAARPAVPATPVEPSWRPYRNAMVIDMLTTLAQPVDGKELAAIRASGLTAINITIGRVGNVDGAFEGAVKHLTYTDRQIAANPGALMRITRAAHFDEAKRTGKVGVMYGFQDTTMYGHDVDRVDIFHQLGVRIVQLTYNLRNLVGDGCLEPGNAGLSKLGRDLVAKLNERSALIDLSHCGQRTTRDGIEASTRPVAITHSGCVAVADSPRNKRDEELRLLADRGGVLGIYIMPFLRGEGQIHADDVVRHIDHAVKVCGEDHVGIGTDGEIQSVDLTPEYKKEHAAFVAGRKKLGIAAPGEAEDSFMFAPDLNTPRRFEQLALRLSRQGYPDARIAKILGGNWARLLRATLT
jgi:membrane dipeptidase